MNLHLHFHGIDTVESGREQSRDHGGRLESKLFE
jgi:hypothetical protein